MSAFVSPTRRRVVVTMLLLVSGLLLYFRWFHVETLGDRRRIAKRLRDWSEEVRRDPGNPEPLNRIRHVLNSKWSFARTHACVILKELGPLARPAVPDLIVALNCGDGYVEREAARALGEVAIGDERAVDPLIAKLYARSDAAYFSAESLGNIGAPAVCAIADLIAAKSQKTTWTPEWRVMFNRQVDEAIAKIELAVKGESCEASSSLNRP